MSQTQQESRAPEALPEGNFHIEGMPEGGIFVQGEKFLFCLPQIDEKKVLAIATKHNLSIAVARVLLARGFDDDEKIRAYLFSSFEQDVAHPSLLAGGEAALERLMRAIDKKEKILIFGDYDVDGVSSSALMLSTLLPLGANINFFLPNRARDGYGLSSKVVKRAVENKYDLIITVDNGITAHDAAKTAQELGIDLIITDHHRQHGPLPQALAVVNPNQDVCTYPCKGLPGVGVIFKIIWWIYEKRGLQLPDKTYELLMLGTIADVVPLVDENRYWVRYGLSRINKDKSYAMEVLSKNGKVSHKRRLSSIDIGFMVAPQINALGRLSDPRDAVKFLISSTKADVERVGKVLLEINEARKEVERGIFDEVKGIISRKEVDLEREKVIIATGKSWPTGVIGLVAGRLMHEYGRPTLMFHETKTGLLKGSCRSIREFNIFDALCACEDLLITFGGHSFAAGLSLKKENLPLLKRRLEKRVSEQLTEFDLTQKVGVDCSIELGDLNRQMVSDLEKLEPFGHQNSQPLFLVRDVTLLERPKLLKDKHVKAMLFSQGIIKPVIFFNRPELYEKLAGAQGRSFHVIGSVTQNEWNGKVSIELLGQDVAF